MTFVTSSSRFFSKNRSELCKLLAPNSAAILFSADQMPKSGDQFFKFRQDSNFFYLTGLNQENLILILFPDHPLPACREILLAQKPDPLTETWYGHKYSQDEIRDISGVGQVRWLDDFETTLKDTLVRSECLYLDQNEALKFVAEVPARNLRFARKLKKDYPLARLERLAPLLQKLRLVKDSLELEWITQAGQISARAFNKVLQMVRPGVGEWEIEAELTAEIVRSKSTGHAFDPIVASGKNACTLHYVSNNQVCNSGDLVLIDFGAEWNYYASDISRTIPVKGQFTPRQGEIYSSVLKVFKAIIPLLTPGQTLDQVQAKTVELLQQEMVKLNLLSPSDIDNAKAPSQAYMKYYMHGVSHFMGLDVHDVGNRQITLQEGMVVTCEPGLYIPEEGIGVRIETDVLVGVPPIDLFPQIPIEIEDLENAITKGS